jgi:hypothetical protein
MQGTYLVEPIKWMLRGKTRTRQVLDMMIEGSFQKGGILSALNGVCRGRLLLTEDGGRTGK